MIPGVYVEEINRFPPSIAQVETAIPAFVGFTMKATDTQDNDLLGKPIAIQSVNEFERYFGQSPVVSAGIQFVEDRLRGNTINIQASPPALFTMHRQVHMFFANGGTKAIIIAAGTNPTDGVNALLAHLPLAIEHPETAILVLPDAAFLEASHSTILFHKALSRSHASGKIFCLLDVPAENNKLTDVDSFRSNTGIGLSTATLSYGAAYFPWLATSLAPPVDMNQVMVHHMVKTGFWTRKGKWHGKTLQDLSDEAPAFFQTMQEKLAQVVCALPPCGAVAGVYAQTDSNRGVWKAPANVSLHQVTAPTCMITEREQATLNVDANEGKSINAIRAFHGKGTLVWGARTMAGNDNEWRYVPVRRFAIMLEQSIKQGLAFAVFEPNDANLWSRMEAMVANFLTGLWRQGALQGSKPEHAFYVKTGLNQSMTFQDIAQGKLIMEIGFAPVRPAEFIILKISWQIAQP